MAVRGPRGFVFLVLLIAGMDLCVDGMVVSQLAFDAGLGQMRRQGVLDPYALVERDEAEDVQSEVRSSE